MWRDLRLSMSALATVARKSFNSKFNSKNGFSDQVFYVTVTVLFDKYLDQMLVKFEQNSMVLTIQNFELFDRKW